MKNDTNSEIREVIDIVEHLYETWLVNVRNRLDNLKRINVDSLAELIEYEKEKGRIKDKNDIIKYIESITQD